MSIITKQELIKLTRTDPDGPFVSIFMPTHRLGTETRQDPIRLKNLITTAEERLIASGLRSPQARSILKPAQALVDDFDFWKFQQNSLAIFLAPGLFRSYRLPLDLPELLVIANRFHLKPLLPLLSDDGQFYILALSQNEVRLFEGTSRDAVEVELAGVPRSLNEALRYDDPRKQQQFHTATAAPGGTGKRPAIFHGQGVGIDEERSNLLRFFQKVDRGLQPLLNERHWPLILAGVDYLFPLYREANSYPGLVDQGIPGNPESLSGAALHERAWPLVEPHFSESRQAAANRYRQLAETGQAANDTAKVVLAAYQSRVETLFVAVGRQQWGNFNPNSGAVDFSPEAGPDSGDLLDLAAIQTLLNGGTVYAVRPEDMPAETDLAAIFRF